MSGNFGRIIIPHGALSLKRSRCPPLVNAEAGRRESVQGLALVAYGDVP
jgi:hypothetical protein